MAGSTQCSAPDKIKKHLFEASKAKRETHCSFKDDSNSLAMCPYFVWITLVLATLP